MREVKRLNSEVKGNKKLVMEIRSHPKVSQAHRNLAGPKEKPKKRKYVRKVKVTTENSDKLVVLETVNENAESTSAEITSAKETLSCMAISHLVHH